MKIIIMSVMMMTRLMVNTMVIWLYIEFEFNGDIKKRIMRKG